MYDGFTCCIGILQKNFTKLILSFLEVPDKLTGINAIKIVTASGSPSVPSRVAAGSGEFTPPQPRVPVAGPASVSPSLAAGSMPEDVVSLQEGGGNFYESTLR
ncbi:hypothetical protein Taro_013644 [Colocasia esculenta]|uniref:Uncharacterized protein n=1 Tax=Colocasia esculenta TaxID=4460 RepID=A0A843UG46_COLES|nr:hypothetical protein [Colocasia esculenta]